MLRLSRRVRDAGQKTRKSDSVSRGEVSSASVRRHRTAGYPNAKGGAERNQ